LVVSKQPGQRDEVLQQLTSEDASHPEKFGKVVEVPLTTNLEDSNVLNVVSVAERRISTHILKDDSAKLGVQRNMEQSSYTLIFDTETTGLFYTNEITSSKLNEYPYMIQLAYELLDETTGDIVESYNSYIQLSDTIEISEQIQHITGITKEKLCEQGIPVVDALVSFYHAYSKSNRIVAHNISFDIKMIQVEIMRNYASMIEKGCPFPENIFNPIYEHIHNKDIFCTMKYGIKITNLWKRSYKSLELPLTEHECIKEHTLSNGQIVRTRLEKKFPKLENLYIQIYDIEPQGLHDAKMDVEICRKVYIYLSVYLCLSRVV